MDISTLEKIIETLPQTDNKTEKVILQARKKHLRSYIGWIKEEDTLLRELYTTGFSISKISELLKRSLAAIQNRIKFLNIENYSDDEKELNKTNNIQERLEYSSSSTIVKQVIKYWRNSLADAEKIGFPIEKMKSAIKFSWEIFSNGKLPQKSIDKFFEDAENKLKEKYKKKSKYRKEVKEKEIYIDKILVIIAPYTSIKNYNSGKKINEENNTNKIFPLWIAATLKRDGELIPCEENIFPWIDRRCLTPNEGINNSIAFPIIGDVAQVDSFYVKNENLFCQENITWKKIFSFGEDLFNSILDNKEDNFFQQHYLLLKEGYIFPIGELFLDAIKNIISTYDQYIYSKNKKIPTLLKQFCSLTDKEHVTDKKPEEILILNKFHLGQMQNIYPLSLTQRISLSYFFDEANNEIFTIHGPPGTGKTSLLSSIIATKWISAAIQKLPPPIIVAASTNNRAVTNILKSFSKMEGSDKKNTDIRWLPEFTSYGLYLASSRKAESAKEENYLYRLREKGSGTVEVFYSETYRESAKVYFLEKFNTYYKKTEKNILNCQNFIYEQLLEKQTLAVGQGSDEGARPIVPGRP
ncbi:MAG: hypothetical protein LEGION0398_MBIBDBAK_01269 [Legionellaceae bacterium]